ncbi:glycosyltransferase family 2 protein [Mesorhizobium sp. B2-3-13]|uniref:glycosyltransferase family 2 protein n=1 Tax=unclassified Mesorhizobium TaxID=325217 RepID=UPI00112DE571|nr:MULTISPECIES: glycosyltransferase family A protein [unclassified Mesorhizobium]TPJ38835.1 glycosyltransferase family 2 protein [Mesorhizobium sp. B2-6-5]TPJ79486.1 glycosyltransferase family 2 protein [Mesorhizobium sp. B2-5-13]TPK46305.1 glycosyltransferase family 2 protein [Mesorhizobium sp. B2-5-5]TPL78471.1 glycosyltransferase family 2 protein [Mesorhizobium sp. B2-3-13]
MNGEPVSVIIPAYNAQDTIDETLRSVRSQSYKALEIIVVDDGSRDQTVAIARRHMELDPRVRLIEQANAGVAAARNRGWQAARSDMIAFVDADDLWAPTKIERQMAVLDRTDEKVGLVYCWYLVVDAQGAVTDDRHRPNWRGDVLERLFHGNFVGNGSAALVRRQALIDAGGFESGLREAGAQGCEDILFYCRVAEGYHFEVVEEPLVGYRYLPGNMSSDMTRMLRSWMLVVDEMLGRHPDAAPTLREGLHFYSAWLLERTLRQRQPRYVLPILSLLLRHHPVIAMRIIAFDLPWIGTHLAKRVATRLARGRGPIRPRVTTRFPIGDLK